MAILTFTLSEEGVSAFRDALICLNKFSEDVSLEARKDSVSLSNQLWWWIVQNPLTVRALVHPHHNQFLQVWLRKLQVCIQPILFKVPVSS